ncbi:MAG TPA: hypothetical protein VF609_14240 [Flavisolibacter sp.]|jgi:hypothetical protein
MNETKTISPTADSMVLKVRRDIVKKRFYFLLWGWTVFLAFLIQFFLKAVIGYRHHYYIWLGLIPVMIITFMKAKHREKTVYTSVVGDCMQYLWTGLGISFFVVGLIGSAASGKGATVYSSFILLYGLGTFVSGRLLRFTPLVAGGIACWVLAVICSFLTFDFQLLTAAAAILISYIIPAYLLNPGVQSWKTIFHTKKA